MRRTRSWWATSAAAHRLRLGFVLALAGVALVTVVGAGWQAVAAQRIRHGDATVRVTATVTDTVRQCGKGSCRWVAIGRYEIDGRVQRDVVLLDGSRQEVRAPQTMLVDPAHPRRAVNLHDHGVVWLVLGPLALVGLVLLVGFGGRALRRPWTPPAPSSRFRPHGSARSRGRP